MNNSGTTALAPAGGADTSLSHHLPRPKPRIAQLVYAAASRLRNRCVIAGSVLGGMVLFFGKLPWLGLALLSTGSLCYAALVVRDLFNPTLIREVHGLSPARRLTARKTRSLTADSALGRPLQFESPAETLGSAELSRLCGEILAAHEQIRIRILDASPLLRTNLWDTYRHCTEMARSAEGLAIRGSQLDDYLSVHQPKRMEGEIKMLLQAAGTTQDKAARDAFQNAARNKQFHITAHEEIRGVYERIRAHLATIRVSLELVEATLVRLRAQDLSEQEPDRQAAVVGEHIEAISLELTSLESGFAEALE